MDQRGLLVPNGQASLRALVDGGIQLSDVVVCLDDLERYLGPGGLDVGLLRRLVGDGDRGGVVVLATIRAGEYDLRYPDHDDDRTGGERDLRRGERELLDQAVELELPRRFTTSELQRGAAGRFDPRVTDALAHAADYGVMEYLAASPRLWRRWRHATAVERSDRLRVGAAIVAAAVDCRGAGLSRPVPGQLLRELYPLYLDGRSASASLPPRSTRVCPGPPARCTPSAPCSAPEPTATSPSTT